MRKISWIIAFALVLVYFLAYRFGNPWIEIFELKTLDLRYNVRGTEHIDPHVVIVGIDEDSLAKMSVFKHDEWPWQRHHYGRFIGKVLAAGAKAVAFDVSFTTPDETNPKSDLYLASVLLRNKKVVLGTYMVFDRETYESYPEKMKKDLDRNTYYLNYAFKMKNFEYAATIMPISVYKIIPPIARFSSAVPSAAFEIGELDVDAVVRNLPLFIKEIWSEEKGLLSGYLPHMDLIAFALYEDVDPRNMIVDFKKRLVYVGNRTVRFDMNGIFHLWYYGDKIFPEYPFYEVTYGNVDLERLVKGKVVLLGYTTSAKGLYDLRSTPFNPNTAGVMIHATAIENFIRGDTLVRIPFYLRLLLVFLVALTANLLSSFSKTWLNFLSLSVTVIYVFLSYYMFLNHIWVDTFYPVMAGVVLSTVNITSNFYREYAEKKKLREFFYRYVPDTVADVLVKQGEIKLGGEKKDIVVLFSDVKGFTAFSESKDPEVVVSVLNEYLTAMADVIRNRYGGTIDKFVGDAIMAVFGAPISYSDEVERALNCALDMREELKKLNEKLRARYGDNLSLDSGIGIHKGEAVVGNIGAPFRMDYTVIGDTVNTASRIESLTRKVDAEILVSDEVVRAAGDGFLFEYVGEFNVKGKSVALNLYSLRGRRERDDRTGGDHS